MKIDLGLPSASEMNQLAHPGGGTNVTEMSREGLVEDLFEAHLRHLDVATKNAVAHRLAVLANSLDLISHGSASSGIDGLLKKIAEDHSDYSGESQSESPAADPDVAMARKALSKMVMLLQQVKKSDIENFGAGTIYEKVSRSVDELNTLVFGGDFSSGATKAGLLFEYLKQQDLGDLAEALGGGDSLLGYLSRDKYSEAKGLLINSGQLYQILTRLAQRGSGATLNESGMARKAPLVDPALKPQLSAMADAVADLYDRMTNLDEQTEYIERSDPERYARIQKRVSAIPNVGRTQDLQFLHSIYSSDKQYRVRAASLAQHQRLIDFIRPIIEQLEAIDLS